MKKVLVPFVAAVMLVAATPRLGAQSKSVIIQKVIVKVNGEVFTLTDLTQRQIQVLRDQNQRQISPQDLQSDATLRKALDDVTPAILVDALDELLLVQRGREIGAKFTDEQFKQAVENIKKENKLDDAGLLKALQQEGLTLQELRQQFERSFLLQSVQRQEIMPSMTLTDEEKRQYYAAHAQEFMTASTVTVRELFVDVPVSTQGGQQVLNVAADEAAKAKIDGTRARALKGEDFVKLVGELSDSGSKANGGLISGIVVNDLSPELAGVLTKLKPGDVSEPIRSAKGYAIFKLESRVEAVPEPFDKVKDRIAQKIYDSRMEGEQKKYLEKLRTQALIEWKDEGYHQMYDKARTTKAGSDFLRP